MKEADNISSLVYLPLESAFPSYVYPGLALAGGGQNLVGSGQSGPWALDTGLISC